MNGGPRVPRELACASPRRVRVILDSYELFALALVIELGSVGKLSDVVRTDLCGAQTKLLAALDRASRNRTRALRARKGD